MSWLYVPGLAGSTSESTSPPLDGLAQSVSWRGKLMRLRYWQRAWKNTSWLRLLYGPTCEPSTADAGVEQLISSARATRASRSLTPADVLEWMTPGTSGPTSHESLTNAGQGGLFLRTSPAICPSGSPKSARIFKAWASSLRRVYSARRKSARHSDESDCSSWPTASAHDGRRPGSDATSTQGANLKRDAERWPTPTCPAPHDSNRTAGLGMQKQWNVAAAAVAWNTPTTRDWKDGSDPSENVPTNSLLGRQAPRVTGEMCPSDFGPRRLNPAFVEWLMGWPHGWTDFAPVAMEWSPWCRLMRSELSRLPWLDA